MTRSRTFPVAFVTILAMGGGLSAASAHGNNADGHPGTMMGTQQSQPGMMGGQGAVTGQPAQGMMGGQGGMQQMMQMMMRMHGKGALMGGQGAMMGPMGFMKKALDANADGVLSPDEIRSGLTARLAEFDADGDGTLSLDEFAALHAAMIRETMVDRFQVLDADGDGQVTEAEIAAFARMKQPGGMMGGQGAMMGGMMGGQAAPANGPGGMMNGQQPQPGQNMMNNGTMMPGATNGGN